METNPTEQPATTEVKKELALTETEQLTTTDEKTLPQLETLNHNHKPRFRKPINIKP